MNAILTYDRQMKQLTKITVWCLVLLTLLLAFIEPAMAQQGQAIGNVKSGVDTALATARYVLYTLAVLVIMIAGVMAAWQGDKSYIIKGLAIAVGVAVAGYATNLVSTLGFAQT